MSDPYGDALDHMRTQDAFAACYVQVAMERAVLQAFRQLQERGVGAIRIALIHDEITITQEDL
jgi:hypothetical protein